MDSSTGVLRLTGNLDFDVISSYTLNVEVSDGTTTVSD